MCESDKIDICVIYVSLNLNQSMTYINVSIKHAKMNVLHDKFIMNNITWVNIRFPSINLLILYISIQEVQINYQ